MPKFIKEIIVKRSIKKIGKSRYGFL